MKLQESQAVHLLGTLDANHPWLIRHDLIGKFNLVEIFAITFVTLSASSSTTMSFATPWTPTLNGQALEPCIWIAPLVENRTSPNPSIAKEAAWTVGRLKAELVDVPKAREAFYECATMIWRLQKVMGEFGEEEDWMDHLEAWLVRHKVLMFRKSLTKGFETFRSDIETFAELRR